MKGAGPVVEVDAEKLWKAINYRLYRTGKTASEISDRLGFSPQIFTDIKAAAGHGSGRGRENYQPSGPVFVTICWWLGADPRDFTRVIRPVPVSAVPAPPSRDATDALLDEILSLPDDYQGEGVAS